MTTISSVPTKNSIHIGIVVALLLMVPLFGNLFVEGWNWGLLDFITMGALLFAAGLLIDFAVRTITDPTYRIVTIAAITFVLLIVWAELAVGAVSQLMAVLLT